MNDEVTTTRGRVALWVVVPVAVTLGLLVAVLATRDPSSARAETSPLIGSLTPEVAGVDLDGSHFDIDDERGRWVVVNFFSTTCVPCIVEHPELVDFQQRNAASGRATVVSVAFDDAASSVAEFFEQNGGDWPVLATETGSIAVHFGVTGVPESYLVAPNGRVVEKLIGGVTADELESLIDAYEQAA